MVSKGIMTPLQAEMVYDGRKYNIFIGAKGSAKTHAVTAKMIADCENNPYNNQAGFRRDKERSISNLGSYFSFMVNFMERKGVQFRYKWKTTGREFKRERSSRDDTKNQRILFGSLEDISGSTDGSAPKNGGFYRTLLIDEPVDRKSASNPNLIPSPSNWDNMMDQLEDNLDRFTPAFKEHYGIEANLDLEIFYTMNDWGEHPLCLLVYQLFPEEEFMEELFGHSIEELFSSKELVKKLFEDEKWIENLTSRGAISRDFPDSDLKIWRTTKFNNPNNLQPVYMKATLSKIKKAMLARDRARLAFAIGTKHPGDTSNDMLAYGDMDIQHMTTQEALDQGYKVERLNYFVDTDETRVFTISPGYRWYKEKVELNRNTGQIVFRKKRIITIDKIIEIPAIGVDDDGVMHTKYIKSIKEAINAHYLKAPKDGMNKKPVLGVDDKRKWYLAGIGQELNFPHSRRLFNQHGTFGINERQDLTQLGFRNKKVFNHPDNKALEADYRTCQRADIQNPKRKTTSSTNYLDRIDAVEQHFVENASVIIK